MNVTIRCKDNTDLICVCSKVEEEYPNVKWVNGESPKEGAKLEFATYPLFIEIRDDTMSYYNSFTGTEFAVTAEDFCNNMCYATYGNDPVNHPSHYTSGKVECIDAMEQVFGTEVVKHYCLGACFKYLWRRKLKENEEQDIKKSLWYFDKFKELINK